MSKSYLINGQNVRIKQHLAGLGSRIVAQAIDLIAVGMTMTAIYYLEELFELYKYDIGWLNVFLVMLPAMFYMPLCEMLFNGQTLGKWLMKIRVVRLDGQPLTLGNSLLRFLLLLVEPIFGYSLACVMIAFTPRSQRLGDLAAGTTVVSDHAFVASRLALEEYSYLLDNYTPHYARAAELTQKQADIIDHVLSSAGQDRALRIEKLAVKVQAICGLPQGGDNELPEYYLFHVLNDWRYYQLDPNLVDQT